ncbi:lung adenoma susceptibility protein 2 [Toxotes jaculatrix]|uniref:lung adenoma susceptibility protein 2 n=1 Tax=Toxotes jaculatrix TaxID=941984 RepID=UPI001B3AB60A|nr:lung adenoma susceptibility protein 2 [Toxotes jaculatrix]XP_040914543.1 lung adenoma susceptibility protein 2 [Toxotes jaculatrix]XP_040914544.1 lung adenoma susceptibility protein 2 [Toxotes jaculatrix]XP_040914545.1 lung adenoma susceptibility protein 2 [Toxotes jaculatrix]
MEHGSLVGEFLSPESTVTSLLSSSGHLRSSLLPPEHNTTFRYRDKDYDSASAALDAYIADFERSCHNSGTVTGRVVLPHSPPSTPSRPRVNTLRNRDVLRESLTERELDFLNLPVSSLHHSGNRDRLSMTTDELLSIPYDGSMPVTHTSAFIQGLLSQSGASQPRQTSSSAEHRACAGLSRSHAAPRPNHHHSHLIRTARTSRRRPGAAVLKTLDDLSSVSSFKPEHRAAGSEWAEPSSLLHLPHRFTRNKADPGSSGMSSVSEQKGGSSVEAWIQRCDRSKLPPPPESKLWDDHGFLPPAAPRTGAPSWVAELEEDDDADQTCSQVDSQLTLRDLRLQFAEQISLLAAERKSSDIMETVFRDNRIECLIQKADQVLNSLSQSCEGADSRADSVSPVNTEEQLLGSPSHGPLFTLDTAAAAAAAAAGGGTEALTDRGAQTLDCGLSGNSIWKQPGPVEALKQMLFRLQAVEGRLQQQEASAAPALTDRPQMEQTPVKQRPEGEAELESFSGGPSLQRALHHLSRLKLLVEEPRKKHREEEEEKDEDEGRYSSSSADGLVCAQQKPF